MQVKKLYIYLFIGIAFVVIALAGLKKAEAESLVAPAPDVRVVIDISGSMKRTDPNNLRTPALNLLTEILPEDSSAGVWTFGRYVNMLVPYGEVDDSWRSQAKEKSKEISSVGLRTNIGEALEKASYNLSKGPKQKSSVILLTDGMVDLSDQADLNEQERQRILSEILPKFKALETQIHTIALSDQADQALLKAIALETGGMNAQVNNPEDLLKTFVKLFDRAVPNEQVPLKDNGFLIDASVKEFTALIFRKDPRPVKLLSPSGTSYSAEKNADHIKWYQDQGFELITVNQPEAGDWLIEAELDPDNRVTVISDLKMRLKELPTNFFAGEEVSIEVFFSEDQTPIVDSKFLRLLEVELRVTTESGRSAAKKLSDPNVPPTDGVYRDALKRLTKPGNYEVRLAADGKTFQRQRKVVINLLEPISVDTEVNLAEAVYNLRVLPQAANLDTKKSRVIAKVSSPDGNSVIRSVPYDAAAGHWHIALSGERGEGRYEVSLNIKGVSKTGTEFRVRHKPIDLLFPVQPLIKEEVPEPLVTPNPNAQRQVDLSQGLQAEADISQTSPETTELPGDTKADSKTQDASAETMEKPQNAAADSQTENSQEVLEPDNETNPDNEKLVTATPAGEPMAEAMADNPSDQSSPEAATPAATESIPNEPASGATAMASAPEDMTEKNADPQPPVDSLADQAQETATESAPTDQPGTGINQLTETAATESSPELTPEAAPAEAEDNPEAMTAEPATAASASGAGQQSTPTEQPEDEVTAEEAAAEEVLEEEMAEEETALTVDTMLYAAAGGGGVLAVGLTALLLIRRKKFKEKTMELETPIGDLSDQERSELNEMAEEFNLAGDDAGQTEEEPVGDDEVLEVAEQISSAADEDMNELDDEDLLSELEGSLDDEDMDLGSGLDEFEEEEPPEQDK